MKSEPSAISKVRLTLILIQMLIPTTNSNATRDQIDDAALVIVLVLLAIVTL